MNNPAYKPVLEGEDNPRQLKRCDFVRIVPVRFALSSEAIPPVQASLPSYMKNVPPKPNLTYTLRTLRNGYVNVCRSPGEKYSWEVTDGAVAQEPAFQGSGKAFFFKLPASWKFAYVAYSDFAWDSVTWERYFQDDTLRDARMHKITWEEDKGIASEDTLCGPPEKLSEWVEEFRPEPGFGKALFEYDDRIVQKHFEPEMGHFGPTREPESIKRRWRRTNSWDTESFIGLPKAFKWLQEKSPIDGSTDASLVLAELQRCKHKLSGVAALADPAGICMECAALHYGSVRALSDYTAWYAEAVNLAQCVEACDAFGWHSRQAKVYVTDWGDTLYPPLYLDEKLKKSNRIPASDAVLNRWNEGSRCLDAHLKTLMECWLAWLNQQSPYSFADVVNDYPVDKQEGSRNRETLLAYGTLEITAHHCGIDAVAQSVDSEDSRLRALVRDQLANTYWGRQTDKAKDDDIPLVNVIKNFTGLFPLRANIARGMRKATAFMDEIALSLADILAAKFQESLPPELAEDGGLARFLCSAPSKKEVPALQPVTQPVLFDQSIWANVALGAYDASPMASLYELKNASDRIKVLQFFYDISKKISSKLKNLARIFPSLRDVRMSPAAAALVEFAGWTLAATSLKIALDDATKKDSLKSGIDVLGNVCATLEATVTFGKKLSLLEPAGGPIGRVTAFLTEGVLSKAAMESLGKVITLGILERVAGACTAFVSFSDAEKAMLTGETRVARGNAILGAGAICLVIPGLSLVGVLFSGLGLYLASFGKTTRELYRIEHGYFGENNRVFPEKYAVGTSLAALDRLAGGQGQPGDEKEAYTPVTRKEVEVFPGFDEESDLVVVPFSYKKSCVPDKALDDLKDDTGIGQKRADALRVEIEAFEILLSKPRLEAFIESGYFHVHLSVPYATPQSTLQIHSLTLRFDILRKDFNPSSKTGGTIFILSEKELSKTLMGCALKEGVPTWYFSFRSPDEFMRTWTHHAKTYGNYHLNTSLGPYYFMSINYSFDIGSLGNSEEDVVFRKAVRLLQAEDQKYSVEKGCEPGGMYEDVEERQKQYERSRREDNLHIRNKETWVRIKQFGD